MRTGTTSTQRTYRYLRIGIVGAVGVMALSLLVVTVALGPVTSLSALFYTPARTLFTGVLFAIALALLALSGHSLEQLLLDLAAVFAPLIALLPTPIAPGDVPGVGGGCAGASPCVPALFGPEVRIGVTTYAICVLAGAVVAVVLTRLQGTLSRGVAVAIGAAVFVAAGALAWVLADPASLMRVGHLVATGVFFTLMIAVAVIAAITSPAAWRRLYAAVAIGMGASLVYLGGVVIARLAGADQTGRPWVLVGEAALIVLFAVYWLAQTVQKWGEVDPSLLPR
ncbi:hypothetical protein [Microbacterium luticocti]|uniref:hypothetical protein n=1 Tax=Microbacterium luticocti TaxID=451764 RepID=UPI000407CD06|nr:hypothetical protein [Microbacterium luticocti]